MQLPLENLTWNGGDMVVCEEFETALYDLIKSVTPWKKNGILKGNDFHSVKGIYSYTYFIQTPDHTCLCLRSQKEDNKCPSYPRRGFCSMLVFYSN